MPTPDSYNLRQKAIAAVKQGEGKTAVSRMFHISCNALELLTSSSSYQKSQTLNLLGLHKLIAAKLIRKS